MPAPRGLTIVARRRAVVLTKVDGEPQTERAGHLVESEGEMFVAEVKTGMKRRSTTRQRAGSCRVKRVHTSRSAGRSVDSGSRANGIIASGPRRARDRLLGVTCGRAPSKRQWQMQSAEIGRRASVLDRERDGCDAASSAWSRAHVERGPCRRARYECTCRRPMIATRSGAGCAECADRGDSLQSGESSIVAARRARPARDFAEPERRFRSDSGSSNVRELARHGERGVREDRARSRRRTRDVVGDDAVKSSSSSNASERAG